VLFSLISIASLSLTMFCFICVGRAHALNSIGHLLRVPNFCASLRRGSV
jgi:hypothetical protein